MQEEADPEKISGFFVHRTIEDAILAKFPRKSALYIAPRVILVCIAGGNYGKIGAKKLCVSQLLPILALKCPTGYTCNHNRTLRNIARGVTDKKLRSTDTRGRALPKSRDMSALPNGTFGKSFQQLEIAQKLSAHQLLKLKQDTRLLSDDVARSIAVQYPFLFTVKKAAAV
jgi:hypothetical protein